MKVTFMGNHKEWRKVAKRERRRKLRIKSAISRDNPFDPESLEYGRYVKNLEALEMFELAEIENQNHIENEKWVKAEQIAIRQWQQLQAKLDSIRQKELKQKEKLKMEYEQEQLKIKETKDRLQKIKEENERKQLLFMKKIEEFLDGASDEPPPELLESEETKPGCEPCPFFAKTAVCRFGDNCSRNHKYCRISNTLLAANMFGGGAAPGADALEAGAGDARRAHRDFYADVLPEFQKYGTVVQFKVCSNQERHLRGNVYVQFSSRRGALAAWRALHARWYAGRQLALRFCHIAEWKNAICGLQSSRRCPKGSSCNFLHVFKNPDNRFDNYFDNNNDRRSETRRSPSWRWSESPELDIKERRRSKERKKHRREHSRDSSSDSKTNRRRSASSRERRRRRRRRGSRDSDTSDW